MTLIDGSTPSWWLRVVRLLIGAGPIGVLWILVVARTDPTGAASLALVLAGTGGLVAGLISSCALASRGAAGGPRRGLRRRPRVLLGMGAAVWGVRQIVISAQLHAGERVVLAAALISCCAVPALFVTLLTLPQGLRHPRTKLRLLLDAVMLSTSITVVLWWLVLQPRLEHPGRADGAAWGGVFTLGTDVLCAVLAVSVWTRDRRPGSACLGVGTTFAALAGIWGESTVLAGRTLGWQPGAIWCVALPLLASGAARTGLDSDVPRDEAPDPAVRMTMFGQDIGGSRTSVISTMITYVMTAIAMASPVRDRWTSIGLIFFVVTIVLALMRLVVNALILDRTLERISEDALRDVLTGLPNRAALTASIHGLDLARSWALLTVDLDGFKEINDLLGPRAADELIISVAESLRRACPAEHLVARIGGDEFGVLAPGTVEDGERLAIALGAVVRELGSGRGDGVVLSASIGVGRVAARGADARGDQDRSGAVAPTEPVDGADHDDRLSALVESAAALRAAKLSGRGRIRLFPGEVEEARRRRTVLEQRLGLALRSGSLEMHAQPIVELRTGRVTGFESLARWTDAVLGQVSPAEFVPLAEQTGLVTALGEFALRNTLLQARAGSVFGREVELGVNVSPIQLRYPTFSTMVVELVDELGLDPGQLLLEVTEAILIDEDDPAAGALALLADAGIHLAIDDFGTGYSAMGYLRRIPMDVLKIDRSWVVAAVTDPRTRDVVGGVVQLAHTLGAAVVMEGVEDDMTADVCRDVGADLGQGWLFGRPRPWPEAVAELEASPTRPVPPLPRSSPEPSGLTADLGQ